jgi:hypothetical protein
LTRQPAGDETYDNMTKRLSLDIFIFGTSIVSSNGIHQRNETSWQRMLAGQFDRHANASLWADGGATGGAVRMTLWTLELVMKVFQFAPPAKAASPSGGR